MVEFAFAELKLHRVRAEPYAANPASALVLDQLLYARVNLPR